MTDENRDTPWRQGTLFVLPDADGQRDLIGVIASHDCDLCADDDVEPEVEWIQAELDVGKNGNLTFGKNARLLQATARGHDGTEQLVTLSIRRRAFFGKREFYARARPFPHQFDDRDVIVFRRWLAARYGRSAFPNAFEDLMRGKVEGKIDELSKKKGEGIRALYVRIGNLRCVSNGYPRCRRRVLRPAADGHLEKSVLRRCHKILASRSDSLLRSSVG